jgi:predicted dehydrogenase
MRGYPSSDGRKKPKMTERLRATVVGVGYWGRFHARKYRELKDVDLVGVVDCNESRAREVAKELGVCAWTHHSEVVGKVDVATVAVPTTEHHKVAVDLLRAGIHLLVEKPISRTLDEAQHMVDEAQRAGVILQVGHLERFNPAIRALKSRLDTPLFVECERISPFPGRGVDVDVVMDLMIHDIDLVLDFLGQEMIHVDAVGVPVITDKYDIVNARFRFARGTVANLTASRVSAKSLRKVRVFQPDAYMSADCGKAQVMIYRKAPGKSEGGWPSIVGERLELDNRDSLLDEVEAFLQCVKEGGTPEVDGKQAMRSLDVAIQVLSSIERNIPEELSRFIGM